MEAPAAVVVVGQEHDERFAAVAQRGHAPGAVHPATAMARGTVQLVMRWPATMLGVPCVSVASGPASSTEQSVAARTHTAERIPCSPIVRGGVRTHTEHVGADRRRRRRRRCHANRPWAGRMPKTCTGIHYCTFNIIYIVFATAHHKNHHRGAPVTIPRVCINYV